MDSHGRSVSLARALLALWRGGRSGVLLVRTELGSSRIAIERGRVCAASALPSCDAALGDVLVADGALDAAAHELALRSAPCADERVGAWLVRAGLTSRAALEATLRRQLRDRVLALFACARIEYRFEPDARDSGLAPIAEPLAAADLVLCALRTQCARHRSVPELAQSREPLRLNALGRQLVRAASLWPEEAAAAALLRQGASPAEIVTVTRGHCRALTFLAALSELSVLEPAGPRSRFGLLLRKRAQLRRGVSARALLDLPQSASSNDARRALRRLALRLHPDALGVHASPQLIAASSEVMGALIAAERELRADAGRPA